MCSNFVKNSVQLFENLTREYELAQASEEKCEARQYMRACRKSYDIYKLERPKQAALAELCVRVLMRVL